MFNTQEVLTSAIQLFPRMDKTISFWDHPNFKTHVALPDDYFAITRVEQGLEMIQQGRLNEESLTVLKVVGDAICANENQLRRYLVRKMSYSKASEHLKKLRKYGFVERHKCRLAFIEEDGEEFIKPPAPFTLGIGGYKLLNHLYPGSRFIKNDFWHEQPLAIQRYVAMNELRVNTVEAKVLRGWEWNPYIGGSPKYLKPFGVAQIESPKGDMQLVLDRPQMAQDFTGYLKNKMELYRYLFERDQGIRIDGFSKPEYQFVCLYVSSLSMAKFIHEEIRLHTYPFTVWILIDEYIDKDEGMHKSFFRADEPELKRMKMSFFEKAQS
ncbi:hypothetical protein [Cytobacillus purgationiresistens]|uniref:Uncharacterized protein n=1 Tax=Cytobacillus purgationiresistens TaxID=863449 RepID=A0ABU0AIW9_9BACI|nr:hypothetical protein [Cytobacillus purgationiresistens]MDQ0271209.1 hypothetical protein [Cytobacillus purgationiresistens]